MNSKEYIMRKLTALFVASTLALGAANLAHAADTTTAPADGGPQCTIKAHADLIMT
jgi:Spy/CpxP family protein refolding chaperone